MINNKLNKLIKCASKKESEAEVRILVRMMNHQMIMVIKKKIVNVSLVLCSNNQRYYMLSSIHIYVATVFVTSLQECQNKGKTTTKTSTQHVTFDQID